MSQDALRSLVKEIRKKTYKEIIKNVSGMGYRIDITL
jgi:DNA-binding response OmpR family regulator